MTLHRRLTADAMDGVFEEGVTGFLFFDLKKSNVCNIREEVNDAYSEQYDGYQHPQAVGC